MVGVSGTFGLGRRGIGISFGTGPFDYGLWGTGPIITVTPTFPSLDTTVGWIPSSIPPVDLDTGSSGTVSGPRDAQVSVGGPPIVPGGTWRPFPDAPVEEDEERRQAILRAIKTPVPGAGPGVLDDVQEDDTVAVDWGQVFSGAVDLIQGQAVGGGNFVGAGPGGAPVVGGAPTPAKVTVDTRTGKVTPCRRRRRRKLLTDQDFACLMQIASLPNKENVRIALAKAIR